MALNQLVRNGVVYIPGTIADIEAARVAGQLIVGRLYETTDEVSGEPRRGRAVTTSKIEWEVTASAVASQISTAVAAEATARAAADATLTSGLATEVAARTAADATLTANLATEVTAREVLANTVSSNETNRAFQDLQLSNRINTEVTDRQDADNALQASIDGIDAAYKAADTALQTSLTNAMNAAFDAYADKDLRNVIKGAYTDGGTLDVATLIGANPVDGKHFILAVSSAVGNVATLTAPISLATGDEVVTFGDQFIVTVDGGVVTAIQKVDDLTKQKFEALDASISALEAATTASAIRSHFSASGDITYSGGVFGLVVSDTNIQYVDDQSNTGDTTVSVTVSDIYAKIANISSNLLSAESGVHIDAGKVKLGGNLTKNATIGGAFDMDYSGVNVVKVPYTEYSCYTATRNGQGYVTGQGAKTTGKVQVWYDENGDPVNLFVPN